MDIPDDPGRRPTDADRGIFALTFDTELIWGSFDHTSPEAFERAYPDVRRTIGRILAILDRHAVPATWAVVGHLFLDRCERDASGMAHPELVRPRQSWRAEDWYATDPCTSRARDPLWYGPDIIDAVLAADVRHEVGCHSFGHALYGDPEMTPEAAHSDLAACVELAARRGIRLESFVFPRNVEGHHEALLAHGFKAFRGADPSRFSRLPRPLRRATHFGEQLLGVGPPVSRPTRALPGLWDIPGSMLFIHDVGLRRAIGATARLRRMRAGLRAAQEQGAVFHLWTHPFNLAANPDGLLPILERIVAEAARERDAGRLRIMTMAAIADDAAEATVTVAG